MVVPLLQGRSGGVQRCCSAALAVSQSCRAAFRNGRAVWQESIRDFCAFERSPLCSNAPSKGLQELLALKGHTVGNQAAPGVEFSPAGGQHVALGEASPDKDGIWRFEPLKNRRRASLYDLQIRHAEGQCIVAHGGGSLCLTLDGDGFCRAFGIGAHPFDGDGAVTRAHIPKKLAGHGGEGRQRCRPDFPFRDVAVMAKGVIGKAWRAGK